MITQRVCCIQNSLKLNPHSALRWSSWLAHSPAGVTVVDVVGDPQFCKLLWYLAEPEVAILHAQTTHFELDMDGGGPYFSEEWVRGEKGVVRYHPAGSESIVPIAYLRTGGEGSPPEWRRTELADDFRLFWSLYDDHTSGEWRYVDESGLIEIGARRTGLRVEVRSSLLLRYLAARQLAAVGQGFFDRRGGSIEQFAGRRGTAAGELHSLHISGGPGEFTSTPWLWTWAKRVILPGPIEDCGVSPFEPPKEYSSFIVGHNARGDAVSHSADPDSLSSYFEDRGTPQYLSPVHFERAVVDRYYADADRYTISDGYLYGPTWGLPIDNDHRDRVIVYLGDLGWIPTREQQHWRVHNIEPDVPISDTAFRRDFEAKFADARAPVWRLHRSREAADRAFAVRFGVPLYRHPQADDAYVGASVHVPTNESIGAFDHEVVPLAKYTVDLLNERGVQQNLNSDPKDKGVKGIGKLEHLLSQHGIGTTKVTAALRDLYGVRTKSGAHSKGSDFNREKLLQGAKSFPERFEQMVTSIADGFDELALALDVADAT